MKQLFQLEGREQGVAAIFIVVIISVAGLIMAFSATMLGLGELDMGYTNQKGGEALAISEGCIDDALHRIRKDNSYGIGAGDINLSLGDGSCIINITDLGTGQRDIISLGTVGIYNKKIQAVATITNGVIVINTWQEKND